jgi:hypothetical protein
LHGIVVETIYVGSLSDGSHVSCFVATTMTLGV